MTPETPLSLAGRERELWEALANVVAKRAGQKGIAGCADGRRLNT